MERFLRNAQMGIEALGTNRFRALLTSLGIIFGVAAVIAMLAIGAGAEKELLDQIRLVGSNNLIIKAIPPDPKAKPEAQDEKSKTKTSLGLSLADVENIKATVAHARICSPEVEVNTSFLWEGTRKNGRLIGVTNHFFELAGIRLGRGAWFNAHQSANAESVCIIGRQVKTQFFPKEDPIGKRIKCGQNWLLVIGVLEGGMLSDKTVEKLSIRNYNADVYIPIKTMLLRYNNRGQVSPANMKRSRWDDENTNKQKENYHQIDRLVVSISESGYIEPSVAQIERILKRRHNEVADYEIVVPELLLRQEQRTKKLFNIVLGVIASISLLVGGIGIMNIMLALVMERIKEIGLRLAIGAQKRDIIMQFITEAVAISFSGGLIGIGLGALICLGVEHFAGIQTIISPFSVWLSFGVAITVGLVFGIYPAQKAAQANPIESLRYE